MTDNNTSTIAVLAILIALHGCLEFAFAALSNCRRAPLQERASQNHINARRALKLCDDLLRLHMANDFMRMVLRFTMAGVAVIGFSVPLMQADGSALNPSAALAIALIPTALASFLFGGVLPAALGSAYADQAALTVAPLMRALLFVLSPILAALIALNRAAIRLAGSEALDKAVTEEAIMTLVNVGQQDGTIEDDEKAMIYSVLQFNETIAREVMIPRPDVDAVEINTSLDEVLQEFIRSGHSRIPVYEDSIDRVRGVLYAKDMLTLLAANIHNDIMRKPLRDIMRAAYFVPETKRADSLFKEMQDNKTHIAIIVDEYGGTAGLLTIEDLIEEIVGDIRDEFDVNEEAEYVQSGEGEYIVDGSMNLDDLDDLLGLALPADDNDSIGGLIYSRLGHVPEIGETLTLDEQRLVLRVTEVDDRRIRKVHITRLPEPPPPGSDERDTPTNGKRLETGKFSAIGKNRETAKDDELMQSQPDVSSGVQPAHTA
ncbi:MAG: hemolysin family protein [Chloroflexota bacterium]|nr:hemolysin family protein [Chloroflexota bacterium]